MISVEFFEGGCIVKKAAEFLDKIFAFSTIKEGSNLMVSDVFPGSCKMIRLALSKKGRIQLAQARQKARRKNANQPYFQAIDRWFPWTWKGIIFLVVGYVPLYFFLLKNNSVWPFDFMWGFADVTMVCMFGLIALVAVPGIRYRNYN